MAFNGILALGSSKRYTEDTVIGMGAIKGASCTVKEYEFDPVTGDTIITFAWLDTTGVEHTEEATVKRGVQGTPGVGITSITKTGTTGLVDTYTILYSDGTTSTFTVTNGSDGGDDKLDVDQGVENAGKVMKVGADGKLVPAASSEGVEIDDTTISSGKVWSSQKTNQKIAGMIDDDSVDGVSTWSSEKISEELAGTISNDQGVENAGKTFVVGEDGEVELADAPDNQIQSDWSQTDTTAKDFIKNKPTKLSDFTNDEEFIDNTVNDLVNYYLKTETYTQSEVNDLIAAVNQFNVEIVDALPTTDIDTHTIYFVPKETAGTNDAYNEYMYISSDWELIGTTEIDLSQYASLNSDNEFLGSATFKSEDDMDTYTEINDYGIYVSGNGGNNSTVINDGDVTTVEKAAYGGFWGSTEYHAFGIKHNNRGERTNSTLLFPDKDGVLATREWAAANNISPVDELPTADYTNDTVKFLTSDDSFYECKSEDKLYSLYYNPDIEDMYVSVYVLSLEDGADVYEINGIGEIVPIYQKLSKVDDKYYFYMSDYTGYEMEVYIAEDNFVETTTAACGYWEKIVLDVGLETKQNKVIETTLADFDDAVADAEDGDLINVKDADGGYDLNLPKTVNQNWQGNGYNLLPFLYKDSGKTVNGITFTVNADGSITANGTATTSMWFNVIEHDDMPNFEIGKTYRLSGCPSGGGTASYFIKARNAGGDTYDIGNGYIFTHSADITDYLVTIRFSSGVVCDNVVFKPMIVEVDDDGNYPTDYQRYAMGNVELTDKLGDVETLLADL